MTLIGLCLNMLGTILVWKFGLPATIGKDGGIQITKIWGSEQTPEMARVDQKTKRNRALSNLGMALILAGFALQALPLI